METILTPHALGLLIEQGYTYVLAKTKNVIKKDTSVSITLTPVKNKPRLEELPLEYDTYFKITREPMQMACGIDDTEILLIQPEESKILNDCSFSAKNSKEVL